MKSKCKEDARAEILARAKSLRGELVRGELLNISEAAEYIHMAPPTLYQKKNQIDHFAPSDGGVILFDSAVLDDWLRDGLVSAGTVPSRRRDKKGTREAR